MPSKNDEFLKAYYVDCQSEMRWRRDVEFKLLAFSASLDVAVIPVAATLSEVLDDVRIFTGSIIALALMLIFVGIFISIKIVEEHKVYQSLGKTVVEIWQYFGLFRKGAFAKNKKLLSEASRKYGAGMGYLRTIRIVWATTVVALLFLGGIALRL
jgi:hypothetical protein